MKTITRWTMKPFKGKDIDEFADDFNRQMGWVTRFADKFNEPVLNLDKHEGYVICTEVVRIPENCRDRLDLAGLRVSCGQCRYFTPTHHKCGECKHCRGELRQADECCEKFFMHWDQGECWLADGNEEYIEAVREIDLTAVRKGA